LAQTEARIAKPPGDVKRKSARKGAILRRG
jgi:hypothetical protein